MTRSFAFTTQGRVHSKDVDTFLMPTVLADTNLFLWVGTWYGMNFKNMPELEIKHGYWIAVGLTTVSTAATYWYFKKKRWLS